jgi:hypothetical protein
MPWAKDDTFLPEKRLHFVSLVLVFLYDECISWPQMTGLEKHTFLLRRTQQNFVRA